MASGDRGGGVLTLDNGVVFVRYDPQEGTFSARSGGRWFVAKARLGDGPKASARVVERREALGVGKSLEVTSPSGRIDTATLFPGLPFVCLRASLRNPTQEPLTVAELTPLVAAVDAGAHPSQLCAFGADGPHPAAAATASYAFLALAHPETRAGVVCGWLTHHRASGIVAASPLDDLVTVTARAEYGRLVVPPGSTAQGEMVAIGHFRDALDGLEAYADLVARANDVKLPPLAPSGYCTWYHAGASDQDKMAELAEFCGEHLRDFGFGLLQIDDGWQIGSRDFSAFNSNGPYSRGMKPTADAITRQGLLAGIWLIPFGWDPKCPALADHPEWFAHHQDGSIYSVHWAGSCLDCTRPETRKFIRQVVARLVHPWGFNYLKIDGLWSGMAVKILYPDPAYREDDLGGAVLHNPAKTQVEAYRDGLRIVREAAGKSTFILGCNVAQNMRTMGASVGLVDGMRIGPDVGADWAGILRCARPASHLYFWNNRVWFNDPDCLMLREPLTLDQGRAWGSLIALSGQMNIVSEWLPGLPPERLDVVKRTMPNAGACGRPIDLFELPLPRLWHLRLGEGETRQDLVGLFNWDASKPAELTLDLAKLGLVEGPYVGFDYWENQFVPPVSGAFQVSLRPASCRVLSLRRALERPQLVSTSRHVTQGGVDVAELRWKEPVLIGKSRLVAGDPYEVRLVAPQAPASWQLMSVTVPAGVAESHEQDGPMVRILLGGPKTRLVTWMAVFKRGPAADQADWAKAGLALK